ncbi:MAG: hypothetical protein LH481_04120 [Burkholderiales bacterium]|nr:hypothetical protein [Burkholderiales bacterium]
MDKRGIPADKKVLDAVLARLRALGLTGEAVEHQPRVETGRYRPDALVRLGHGEDQTLYTVEVKTALRPANLGVAMLQLQPYGDAGMLFADYVTPQIAEILKAQNIAFADAVGNAYINRPTCYIYIKGEKPTEGAYAPKQIGRAFQGGGLRVLFALMCNRGLVNETYRAIAKAAGVAHGTVGWVMAELPGLGFVGDIADKRRLLQPERLLQQWVEAYARKLRPKLVVGRYQAADNEWQKTIDPIKYGAVWGGENAAAKLTNILRPEITTLYIRNAEPGQLHALMHAARLRPDAAGNVEVVNRFWEFEQDAPELAPHILVYADLLATGDARCIEAARELHGEIVARFG